jgi:hypothetical protein
MGRRVKPADDGSGYEAPCYPDVRPIGAAAITEPLAAPEGARW